jgi:hypothetical protein
MKIFCEGGVKYGDREGQLSSADMYHGLWDGVTKLQPAVRHEVCWLVVKETPALAAHRCFLPERYFMQPTKVAE